MRFIFNILILLVLITASYPAAAAAPLLFTNPPSASLETLFNPKPLDPFRTPQNPWGVQEHPWPEQYIAPALKHGLDSLLPQALRGAIFLDAGYDRILRRPSFSADSSVPIRAWPDKTILLSQRASWSATSEWHSVGAGIRTVLSAETVVGFHFFHDWTRNRGVSESFLKEVGVGVELRAQPGLLSDISFSANAYIPVNEREAFTGDGGALVRERFSFAWDARFTALLPKLAASWDARAHIEANGAARNGGKAGLNLNSRDGLWHVGFELGRDGAGKDHFKVEGGFSVALDFQELIEGKSPFSAPYKATTARLIQKAADGLYDRSVRRYDLPTERIERRTALTALTRGQEVLFEGGFPDFPSETFTVQTASSPWRDTGEVTADQRGFFSGSLKLPPGTHRIRLTHKPSGRMSEIRTVTIEPPVETGTP